MSKEVIKRGTVWYASTTYGGVRLRESLKTTDMGVAIDRLLDIKSLIREGVWQLHKTKFEEKVKDYNPVKNAANKKRELYTILPIFAFLFFDL